MFVPPDPPPIPRRHGDLTTRLRIPLRASERTYLHGYALLAGYTGLSAFVRDTLFRRTENPRPFEELALHRWAELTVYCVQLIRALRTKLKVENLDAAALDLELGSLELTLEAMLEQGGPPQLPLPIVEVHSDHGGPHVDPNTNDCLCYVRVTPHQRRTLNRKARAAKKNVRQFVADVVRVAAFNLHSTTAVSLRHCVASLALVAEMLEGVAGSSLSGSAVAIEAGVELQRLLAAGNGMAAVPNVYRSPSGGRGEPRS